MLSLLQTPFKVTAFSAPVSAFDGASQQEMQIPASNVHKSAARQVDTPPKAAPHDGLVEPSSQQGITLRNPTLAEELQPTFNAIPQKKTLLQVNTLGAKRNDAPQATDTNPQFSLATNHKRPTDTASERPEVLSTESYIAIEEAPPGALKILRERDVRDKLDEYLRALLHKLPTKMQSTAMALTKLSMAYVKSD